MRGSNAGRVMIAIQFGREAERDRRPAVGFIRSDQIPDPKKYTLLLEENSRLRAELTYWRR
jgi:hypothetical protein